MALSDLGELEATDAHKNGGQPFWRRSWKIDVAISPYSWTPPRVRSPVQMMISVRAGRIASTCFRESERVTCEEVTGDRDRRVAVTEIVHAQRRQPRRRADGVPCLAHRGRPALGRREHPRAVRAPGPRREHGVDRVPAVWHGDSWMIPLLPIKSTSYGADQQSWGGDVGGIL